MLWTSLIEDLNREEIVAPIYKKKLYKTNQTRFTVLKIIKRKDDKLYVKWKGFESPFNSWVDKKDIIISINLFS